MYFSPRQVNKKSVRKFRSIKYRAILTNPVYIAKTQAYTDFFNTPEFIAEEKKLIILEL